MKEKKYLIVDKETGVVIKETNRGERSRGGAWLSLLLGFVGGLVAVALAVGTFVAYIGMPVAELPQTLKEKITAEEEKPLGKIIAQSADGKITLREKPGYGEKK